MLKNQITDSSLRKNTANQPDPGERMEIASQSQNYEVAWKLIKTKCTFNSLRFLYITIIFKSKFLFKCGKKIGLHGTRACLLAERLFTSRVSFSVKWVETWPPPASI